MGPFSKILFQLVMAAEIAFAFAALLCLVAELFKLCFVVSCTALLTEAMFFLWVRFARRF